MLGNFLEFVVFTSPTGSPSRRGPQVWYFRDLVNAVVQEGGNNVLTRAAVLEQAPTVTDFTADFPGWYVWQDQRRRPAGPSRCFVLTQVRDGEFVRVTPKSEGKFNCKKSNVRPRSSST